ncbi:hypothetical protein BH23CHL2_BH23CHL2_05550 [soil metagenome]
MHTSYDSSHTVRRFGLASGVLLLLALHILAAVPAAAFQPGNQGFQRTWQRTDKPVLDGIASRTWMWGPEAFSEVLDESYQESPGGSRQIQYFDKSRMEITDPSADSSSIWYVTNGLLVVELITGQMQVGNDSFETRSPAMVNVAGDFDDPDGPTYATFGSLLDAQPHSIGTTIIERVDRQGKLTNDPALASQAVTVGHLDPVTHHAIAAPFWALMNSSGTVYENGQFFTEQLFENEYFATGRPVTEAYWANVKVGGQQRDVLMQCFERRCLTFTPGNPEGFVVEAGNVGQHYYSWRYANDDDEAPGPDSTPAPSPTPAPNPTPEPTPEPATEYEFLHKWSTANLDVTVDSPSQVAAASSGEIYVAASDSHQILKFAPNGLLLNAWPEEPDRGDGEGEFDTPTGIAVDNDGFVYVTDFGNHRVQKFDPDGGFVTAWGGTGEDEGSFNGPYGISVGQSSNEVYVTDLGNHRVQVFSTNGEYLRGWGRLGTRPAQFDSPHGITVAPDGSVYIADTGNSRVLVHSSTGTVLSAIDSPGSNGGQLLLPVDVEVFDNGDLLVSELGNDRVQAFSLADGSLHYYEHLGYLGLEGSEPGEFVDPKGVAIDSAGDVYIADSGNDRIQKFDDSGAYLDEWIDGNRARFRHPLRIEVDPAGRVFVPDLRLNTIPIFGPDGTFLDQWGPEIPGTTPLTDLVEVVFDADGNAFIIDVGRVIKVSPEGDYIAQFGSSGDGDGQFIFPIGIAIDSSGNIYVADVNENRGGHIKKFAPDFSLISVWDSVPDSVPGGELLPNDIVIYGDEAFVFEAYGRISVFDLNGKFLRAWGSTDTESKPGTFASGLTIDQDGYIYAVHDNVIHKYSRDGAIVATFGSPGDGDGELNYVTGITVGPNSHVYAMDINSELVRRVQVFQPVS